MSIACKTAFLLMIVSLICGCTNIIFQPMRPHYISLGKTDIKFDDVYLPVESNIKLHGWKLYSEKNAVKGTILFFSWER